MNAGKGSPPGAFRSREALDHFLSGHVPGLCVQQAIMRLQLRFHFGNKVGLLPPTIKAVDSPSSVFLTYRVHKAMVCTRYTRTTMGLGVAGKLAQI